jgi:hypothetical protein
MVRADSNLLINVIQINIIEVIVIIIFFLKIEDQILILLVVTKIIFGMLYQV